MVDWESMENKLSIIICTGVAPTSMLSTKRRCTEKVVFYSQLQARPRHTCSCTPLPETEAQQLHPDLLALSTVPGSPNPCLAESLFQASTNVRLETRN